MTEYTLAQVIDKLGRNKNLKFQFVEENYKTDKGFVVALDEYGCLVDEAGELMLSNFSIGSKFRLLDEPVSFTEAARAFEDGKNTYCLYDDERIKYVSVPDPKGLNVLQDENGNSVSIEEILHGKWFIEGDD